MSFLFLISVPASSVVSTPLESEAVFVFCLLGGGGLGFRSLVLGLAFGRWEAFVIFGVLVESSFCPVDAHGSFSGRYGSRVACEVVIRLVSWHLSSQGEIFDRRFHSRSGVLARHAERGVGVPL